MTTFIGILRQMGKPDIRINRGRKQSDRENKYICSIKSLPFFPYLCPIKKTAYHEPLSVQSRK